ncbi:MAG: AraC family transcriptional regulator [Leptospirales bacterium]|nr:AraC family transcriptional regulator [Leptospirales bacterium]
MKSQPLSEQTPASEGRRARIVPRDLLSLTGVTVIAAAGDSALLFKRLTAPLYEQPILSPAASLTIVLRGRKELHFSGGRRETLRAGDALFLAPEIFKVSDLFTAADGVFEQYLLFFDRTLLLEFLQERPLRLKGAALPPPALRIEASAALKRYLASVSGAFGGGARSNARMLRLKLLESLELIDQADRSRTFADWLFQTLHRQVRDPLRLVEELYASRLSLEDFASLCNCSLSSFQRAFRRQTGQSPGKWIQRKRMEHARRLLSRPEQNVTDAALALGYENISHFIRIFRRAFGLSPAQYRQRQFDQR